MVNHVCLKVFEIIFSFLAQADAEMLFRHYVSIRLVELLDIDNIRPHRESFIKAPGEINVQNQADGILGKSEIEV